MKRQCEAIKPKPAYECKSHATRVYYFTIHGKREAFHFCKKHAPIRRHRP